MMQTMENASAMLRFPYGRKRRKMGKRVANQMPKGMGKPMLKVMKGKMMKKGM